MSSTCVEPCGIACSREETIACPASYRRLFEIRPPLLTSADDSTPPTLRAASRRLGSRGIGSSGGAENEYVGVSNRVSAAGANRRWRNRQHGDAKERGHRDTARISLSGGGHYYAGEPGRGAIITSAFAIGFSFGFMRDTPNFEGSTPAHRGRRWGVPVRHLGRAQCRASREQPSSAGLSGQFALNARAGSSSLHRCHKGR